MIEISPTHSIGVDLSHLCNFPFNIKSEGYCCMGVYLPISLYYFKMYLCV